MKVRFLFNVSAFALPAVLTVRDFNGNLVFYKKVFVGKNCVCFKTLSRNLIITVRPVNSEYLSSRVFIKLPCACFYLLRYNFVLFKSFNESEQEFYLQDENYSFPVKSALLSFYGKS